ncbi:3015_t:CDS:10, partial [Ambispora gerdemannii]
MYNYVVTAHKPSTVHGAVTGSFTSPDVANLILHKLTRVEIFVLAPEGLKSFLDFPVYGRIANLKIYRPVGRKTDLLFISTESYKFFVLSFDMTSQNIVTESMGDLSERVGTPADNGQICVIDPACRLLALHLYHGNLKVIPMEMPPSSNPKKRVVIKGHHQTSREPGQFKDTFNIRLSELQIQAMTFLYQTAQPTLLMMHEDVHGVRQIKTYIVNIRDEELIEGPLHIDDAGNVLAIAAVPKGGILVITDLKITFYDREFRPNEILHSESTPVKIVAPIDLDGSRYLLGDDKGELRLLVIPHVGPMKIEILGKTSLPHCIVYLDNGFAFVGSHFHDSVLIKLRHEPNEQGSYFDVVERFTNLAPIADFCVVDLERQGQGQIVTCSGGYQDGTLRIIRNGVGITDQATLEMRGIRGVWSLRPYFDAGSDDTIVISFASETRILTMIDGEELQEVEEFYNFNLNNMTLHAANILGNMLVQVTEESIRLINCMDQSIASEWFPSTFEGKITVASVNPTQVTIALGGGCLVYFEIRGTELVQVNQTKLEHEIACLNINPIDPLTPYKSAVVAVGLWTEISVAVLSLPELKLITKESLGGEVMPRSVLFARFDNMYYLLAALGDGQLFNFIFDPVKGTISEKKRLLLGTQPVTLTTFISNGTSNVFAASDRPTVIYSSNKKLLYSNVNAKEVTYMCPFNSASFPNALVITHEEGLTIGTIDDISKLHIRTIPLNEMARRICYQEASSTFGILTIRAYIDEPKQCYFRILDDHTFDILDAFRMELYEIVQSLTTVKFDDSPDSPEFYAVGTAFALPNEDDCHKGRILIFLVEKSETTQKPKLRLISSLEIMGAVYSLAPLNNYLVASINSKVTVFKLTLPDSGPALVPICSKCGFSVVYCIVTRGDFVIVGDLMRSISLLLYKPLEEKLEEIAKDWNMNWMNAVEALDDDEYIGADTSYNLFTVRRNSDSTLDDVRSRLDEEGVFHLGDMVNRFRHGSLAMNLPETDPIATPLLLYCTVSGAIGVIATVNEKKHDILWELQRSMRHMIKGIGGLKHKRWRSFNNERRIVEARKFLDGDLIESFLDLSRKQMEQISEETGYSVEDLFKTAEELTR